MTVLPAIPHFHSRHELFYIVEAIIRQLTADGGRVLVIQSLKVTGKCCFHLITGDEGDIAVRKRFFCDRSLCDDLSLCDELSCGIRILRSEGDGCLMFL